MAQEGWVPITTVTGSGNPASIEITGIPSTYAHLCLIGDVASTRAAVLEQLEMQLNGDTGSNYQWQRAGITNGTTIYAYRGTAQTEMYVLDTLGSTVATDINATMKCNIFGYSDSSRYTNIWAAGGYGNTASYGVCKLWSGTWEDASVVSAIKLTCGAGNFTTTSRLTLYGFGT